MFSSTDPREQRKDEILVRVVLALIVVMGVLIVWVLPVWLIMTGRREW